MWSGNIVFNARLYWSLCSSSGEQEQATDSLACSLPEGRWTCSPYGVRVGVCSGAGPEGWLKWFAGGGHAQYPAFTPCFCSTLFKRGSWVFLTVSFVHNLPQPCILAVTFSPIVSLHWVALREVCLDISIAALQQKVSGPCLLLSPLRDSTSLLLIGKDLTASSDTSSNWRRATDTSWS